MKKISKYFFVFNLIFCLSCSDISHEKNTVRIKGSDTMLYLARSLAIEYMSEHPGTVVIVEGGGTAAGVSSLVNNEVDILTASRNLKPEEIKLLAEKQKMIGISHLIAKDALSIFINKENTVRNFSSNEVKKIFTGEINNWNVFGGEDADIEIIIRSPNSGTYLYFKEHVLLGEEYAMQSVIKATTQSIIEEINSNIYAVGYGGIGYGTEEISASIDGVFPSEENVLNDTYPLSRYLHFYTITTPTGKVRDFINWTMSPAGQQAVKQSGYIAIW
jgi:phosphate transport system substrate-binding protein